jgi:transcriptional regulator with XRE-family HTH domain
MARIGPKKPIRVFLAEWRDHHRLSQEELGSRLGTSKATVSRKENQKRSFDVGYVAAVAEALGRDFEDMFRHPDQPTQQELLHGLSPEGREAVLAVVESLRKTGTR